MAAKLEETLRAETLRRSGTVLVKSTEGEGSRGGQVVGHTPAGKPVYASKKKPELNFVQIIQREVERENAERRAANPFGKTLKKKARKRPVVSSTVGWQHGARPSGPGSHGGHVIGHSQETGRPVYRTPGYEKSYNAIVADALLKATQLGLFGEEPAKVKPAKPKPPKIAVAPHPPAGFTAIPGSTRGGYHKRVGNHFVYWYPDTGVTSKPHAEEHPAIHAMHEIVHSTLAETQPQQVQSRVEVEHGKREEKPEPGSGHGDTGVLAPAPGGPGRPGEVHEGPGEKAHAVLPEEGPAEALATEGALPPGEVDPRPVPEVDLEHVCDTIAEDLLPPVSDRLRLPDSIVHFPHPAELRDSAGNVTGHISELKDHQQEGAERMLTAWEVGDGVLLQDSAGLGKTLTALAAMQARGGKKNLIVVPVSGKEGLKQQWEGPENAGLYGIDVNRDPSKSSTTDGTYLVSYDDLLVPAVDAEGKPVLGPDGKPRMGVNPVIFHGEWDTIIFDESHNMTGHGVRAEAAKQLQEQSPKAKVGYLSATPFTNVTDMHYLVKLGHLDERGHRELPKGGPWFDGSPESFAHWAEIAGAQVDGLNVKNPTSSLKPMARIAATMHVDGLSILRTARLDGAHSHFTQMDSSEITDDQRKAFATASEIMNLASDEIHESLLRALNVGWAKQYWEVLKAGRAVELAKEELAKGRQVALFTCYKKSNHEHLRAIPRMLHRRADRQSEKDNEREAERLHGLARDIEQLIDTLPAGTSVVKDLVNALGGSRQVAEIHGATTKKPADEQRAYQEGKKQIVVCTMARGGTGISLHDKTGEHPRTQINLGVPWSGREFTQVAGRSHRLGSKSETEMHWLLGDDENERHNAGKVAKRLRSMGCLTSGNVEAHEGSSELAAFENGIDFSADSDDADELVKQVEAAQEEIDKGNSVDGLETAQEIRDYFRQFGEQRAAGRDVLAEGRAEAVERRKKEAERAAHRAAEQLRQHKNWQIEYVPGKGFWFNWRRTKTTEGIDIASNRVFKRMQGRAHRMPGPEMHTGWLVPADAMEQLAKYYGAHELKVDLREADKKRKDAEAKRQEEAKAHEAAETARYSQMAPDSQRAMAALHKHTEGRMEAARYAQQGGKTYWHLTERRPPTGDSALWTHRETIKAMGGRYQDSPMHGGKGYLVPEDQLPEIAARVIGHEEWRKSYYGLVGSGRDLLKSISGGLPGGFTGGGAAPAGYKPGEAKPIGETAARRMGMPTATGQQHPGEGSRGGHVIGHSASGRPIYQRPTEKAMNYKDLIKSGTELIKGGPPAGTFAEIERKVRESGSADDPAAVAAKIYRQKYGAETLARRSAAARKKKKSKIRKSYLDLVADGLLKAKPIAGQIGLFGAEGGGGAAKPPSGYEPVSASKHGGYRKRHGAGFVYWYPDVGEQSTPRHPSERVAEHRTLVQEHREAGERAELTGERNAHRAAEQAHERAAVMHAAAPDIGLGEDKATKDAYAASKKANKITEQRKRIGGPEPSEQSSADRAAAHSDLSEHYRHEASRFGGGLSDTLKLAASAHTMAAHGHRNQTFEAKRNSRVAGEAAAKHHDEMIKWADDSRNAHIRAHNELQNKPGTQQAAELHDRAARDYEDAKAAHLKVDPRGGDLGKQLKNAQEAAKKMTRAEWSSRRAHHASAALEARDRAGELHDLAGHPANKDRTEQFRQTARGYEVAAEAHDKAVKELDFRPFRDPTSDQRKFSDDALKADRKAREAHDRLSNPSKPIPAKKRPKEVPSVKIQKSTDDDLRKALPKPGTEGGHKTPPKEYRESGATEERHYADPANYKYPIDTEDHVRAAISYFSKPKNAGVYSPAEQKAIWGRIRRAAKKFEIEIGEQSGPPSVEKSMHADPMANLITEGLSFGLAAPLVKAETHTGVTPDMAEHLEAPMEAVISSFQAQVQPYDQPEGNGGPDEKEPGGTIYKDPTDVLKEIPHGEDVFGRSH